MHSEGMRGLRLQKPLHEVHVVKLSREEDQTAGKYVTITWPHCFRMSLISNANEQSRYSRGSRSFPGRKGFTRRCVCIRIFQGI